MQLFYLLILLTSRKTARYKHALLLYLMKNQIRRLKIECMNVIQTKGQQLQRLFLHELRGQEKYLQ
jgi:hypothetical protein